MGFFKKRLHLRTANPFRAPRQGIRSIGHVIRRGTSLTTGAVRAALQTTRQAARTAVSGSKAVIGGTKAVVSTTAKVAQGAASRATRVVDAGINAVEGIGSGVKGIGNMLPLLLTGGLLFAGFMAYKMLPEIKGAVNKKINA